MVDVALAGIATCQRIHGYCPLKGCEHALAAWQQGACLVLEHHGPVWGEVELWLTLAPAAVCGQTGEEYMYMLYSRCFA
jgi:hypothetical protein